MVSFVNYKLSIICFIVFLQQGVAHLQNFLLENV